MKNSTPDLFVILILIVAMLGHLSHHRSSTSKSKVQSPESLSSLYTAIVAVESSGGRDSRAFAEKPSGELGEAQIRPCVLRDLDQFLGLRYSLNDRLDSAKSFEIFKAYTGLWIDRRNLEDTLENRARIWNAGPNLYNSAAASAYWAKVKNFL